VPSTAFPRYRTVPRIVNYITYLVGALVLGLFSRRPDVVVTATDPPLVGLVGLCISRVRRTPLVHLLWDVQPQVAVAAGLLPHGRLVRLLDALNRYVLRRAISVITPTQAIRNSAVQLGALPDRVEVVSHWEDTSVVTVQPKDNVFSRKHGLTDRFVLMYSGNIGLTQDLVQCLELASRLRDLDDVVMLLIGEGAAKRTLQARVKTLGLDNVRFLPYQSRAEMMYAWGAADVFVVPLAAGLTRFMLPSKIFTIMACGRPMVAALDRWSDIAGLVSRGGCGLITNPGDVAALEQRVRWLREHESERVAMGARARRTAENLYARTVVTPAYLELLRRFEPVASAMPAGLSRSSRGGMKSPARNTEAAATPRYGNIFQ
jgi:glycosyltransferase involved in cell wall biosynthesis